MTDILKFWFPDENYHKWWFISDITLDQKIYELFYNKMKETYDNFDKTNYQDIDSKKILIDIILLDQFSRNINRVVNNLDILDYTKKASILSNIWINKNYYLSEPIMYTVFAFLPIRHLKNKKEIGNLILILNDIEIYYKDNNIYNKFKFHTIKDYESLII